jgi:hypothetical protein
VGPFTWQDLGEASISQQITLVTVQKTPLEPSKPKSLSLEMQLNRVSIPSITYVIDSDSEREEYISDGEAEDDEEDKRMKRGSL